MDFVVVGFGIGSICILAGLILRDAPGWWVRLPGRRPAADDGAGMGKLCRALGAILLAGGIALSIVTLVALFAGFSDGTGAILITSAVTLFTIGIVAWAVRWRQRFAPPRRAAAVAVAAAAPLPLAVAIERGLALERAVASPPMAAGAEADDAIEASGLTVERTVMAQERRELPEAAEAAKEGHDGGEHHRHAAHHAETEAPNGAASGQDVHPDHAHAGEIGDRHAHGATFDEPQVAGHAGVAPGGEAPPAEPAPSIAQAHEKPRESN